MNTRIKRFMDYKSMTPSELADAIGVQRSNITHVLHGRNKPGFQFITKMLEAFPEIDAKWLLTGEGEMLVAGKEKQSALFRDMVVPPPVDPVRKKMPLPEKQEHTEKKANTAIHPIPEILQSVVPDDSRKIASIVVLYTDQTFKQYLPSK